MGDRGYVVEPAKYKPAEYLRQILRICRQEKIKLAFVCNENEQLLISQKLTAINRKLKTIFIVQKEKTIVLCQDKLKMFPFMQERHIRYPESYATQAGAKKLIKKFGYPIIIKPRGGYGGYQKVCLIHNPKELKLACKNLKNQIFQEYIDNKKDEEYTVGLFLNKNSKVLGCIAMLRRLRFSMTWHAIIDDYPDITVSAIRAAEAVGALGPTNVQLRRGKNNQPYIIEINPRVSSTAILRAKLGFNEAEASLDYFLKQKRPSFTYQKAVAMRVWDELVIPTEKYYELKKRGQIIN